MIKVDIDSLSKEQLSFGKKMAAFGIASMLAGIVLLAVCFSVGKGVGMKHFYYSYLVAYCFFLSLSLGALFFLLVQNLLFGVWSIVVRRLTEIFVSNIPLMALLSIPISMGLPEIYPWAAAGPHDALLIHKQPYLNQSFFEIRMAIYFVIWSAIALYYTKASLKQDVTGDPAVCIRMKKLSGPAIALFAVTVTYASFDLLKSTDPYWFSSMYGVYFFSASCMGFFASLTILTISLGYMGKLRNVITNEHRHDMGKYLFGFVFFWAYIAFSQYLLMWYTNTPEETIWYLHRQEGGWAAVSLMLVFGHFLVPFVVLVTRQAKKCMPILAACALWLIIMHWVDIYWLIMPQFSESGPQFHIMDLLALAGIGLICKGAASIRYAGKYLIPFGDPRLPDAISYHGSP